VAQVGGEVRNTKGPVEKGVWGMHRKGTGGQLGNVPPHLWEEEERENLVISEERDARRERGRKRQMTEAARRQ